jgi:ATP-binding cassette, subfamily B (MDR/TAP), member 1
MMRAHDCVQVAFAYSWQLTLALSSAVLFILIVMNIIVPLWLKFEARINHENGRASGLAGEAIKNIRTLKSLGAEETILSNYRRHIDEARRIGMQMTPVVAFQISPVFFALYSSMALGLWLGVKFYVSGTISSFINIIVAFSSVLLVTGAMGGLVGPVEAIVKAVAASISLFRVIDAPQRDMTGKKDPDVDAGADIIFEDVKFTYPSRPTSEVLKLLNFRIPAGKVTALVGPSGCGKSTTVGLIERWYHLSDVNERLLEEEKPLSREERLYEKMEKAKAKKMAKKQSKDERDTSSKPITVEKESEPILQNSGTIHVGDMPIESLDAKWWRSQIGLVQQEPHLFNETIYENVHAGLTGSLWEDEPETVKRQMVEAACKDAYADEFIRRLPAGYETQVGEGAIQLSGGQRQRLAIARAVVKRPKILLLDEATSSIDVRSEQIVQAAINRASQNRTTLMIAHRLSTIRQADQIVVMREGRAVESGTHDSLMRIPNGVYEQMVVAQRLNMGGDGHMYDLSTNTGPTSDDTVREDKPPNAEETKNTVTSLWSRFLNSIGLKPDTRKAQKGGEFRAMGRILYELIPDAKLLFPLVGVAACIAGSMYAMQSYLLSHFLTIFIQPKGPQMVSDGAFWALWIFVMAVGILVAYTGVSICMSILSTITAAKYAVEYLNNILAKSISWFEGEDRDSGSLTAHLSNDPKQLQQFIGLGIVVPLVSAAGLIGCVILAFYYGWKLSIVVFFAALPVLMLASFIRVRYELVFAEYNAVVFSKSSKFAAEGIAAYRTVTALTMEGILQSRYETLLQGHVNAAFKKARLACLVFALSDSVDLLCIALTTWYGGILMQSREYGPLQFYIIYYALIQGGQAVGQTLAFLTNLTNAAQAASRIMKTRDTTVEPKTLTGTSSVIQNGVSDTGAMRVEFEGVSFTYPTRDVPVYTEFNLSIKAGSYVAIVGASGCGKTTIISMLSRFYHPSQGRILVDGHDLRDLPINKYRQSTALVSQEPTLFGGTITENLKLGIRTAEEISQKEVENACRAADIHDFIISLPDGYGTRLHAGTHASLSGGQKQRLCVARALLRKPRLLLLDEATSSLDSKSERMVQTAVEKIAQDSSVTIIAVAHRLATIQGADKIILLGQGGRILEEGSHAQLIARQGLYCDMARAQALG